MVTCFIEYIFDTNKIKAFEYYAKLWTPMVNKFGGQHHGYFLPSEGASNITFALFTSSSLVEYEKHRDKSFKDKECMAAFDYAAQSQCIKSYQPSFFRPLFQSVL